MPVPIMNALVFLIGLAFNIYIMVVILRMMLQTLNAPYHNPITQLVIRLTQPLVKPLQYITPGFRGFDFAIVVLLLLLELLRVLVMLGLIQQTLPDVGGWFLWSIAAGLEDILDVYFYLFILGAILSWFANMHHHPLSQVVALITDPVLGVIRRIIPVVRGFDFSPLIGLVLVKLIQIMLIAPLAGIGMRLALS